MNPANHNSANLDWYCVRTLPKQEHIATAHLRHLQRVECFTPRIRFKRATQRGAEWVTEALFPGYLFARFDLQLLLRLVQSARGVQCVVRFGTRWPTISNQAIQEIRLALGPEELRVIGDDYQPGEPVLIATGAFKGLHAVVTQVMPGRERIAVLMEFLGQPTEVELPADHLVRADSARALQGF